MNWATFFVCGLPGGVDYVLLFLVKQRYMEKRTEKAVNRFLNMWIRLPGIVAFVPFAYCCYAAGRSRVSGHLLVVQSLLNCVNGIYFADRVVANEAVFSERLKAEQQHKAK